ncbi:MAG: hypothetical protein DCC67_06200 [Planctomycetota bacterium]|nr:MAG: hypothetical protein DCC67_06200 [Planctomycetota bacterium]
MAARQQTAATEEVRDLAAAIADGDPQEASGRYVGQWNRLVSTTNWEKGRIICQWREALVAAGAAATDYSDEAWSQLVGGVTSQHVGRLRRVYQKFGGVYDQYEGLYWSHFQASLDWEDAEMWLEGAIHNGWSVSQMRGKRWETLGKPGEAIPGDDALGLDELEDAADADPLAPPSGALAESAGAATMTAAEAPTASGRDEDAYDERGDEAAARSAGRGEDHPSPKSPAKSRQRLPVEVDELPEDVADAFEQFKLAIIAQRRLGWSETTPEAVIECLDALRELALAPLDD